MPGTLFVVATPIGNLEDITARALRILREVAVIAAEDTRRTSHLLARYAIATPTTSLHEHNERQKSASLIDRLQRGDSVALVSDAGTPTVSDPGQRLIQRAIETGIAVEPIPGPSAVVAALSVSGVLYDSFHFYGYPPIRANARSLWFERLRNTAGTAVFFEAPHRIRETLTQLQTYVGDAPAALCREMTKAHQELVRGPISALLGALRGGRGEYTVVVNIGQLAETSASPSLSDTEMAALFGEITEKERLSRRKAISVLARRHRMRPNDVYQAVERGLKLGKQQK